MTLSVACCSRHDVCGGTHVGSQLIGIGLVDILHTLIVMFMTVDKDVYSCTVE